ncbi:MAG: class I SAM-dependent methyltransferase [Chloroflexota bacterium]
MTDTKQEVREFYDNVGWQQEEDGLYQNARYDDLRPVAAEYVQKTRLRVNRVIAPTGRFFLDAGSGPVQYDEYLTYSEGYRRRVCFDISIQALTEARKRIGDHGLFVVGDIANLPFEADAFDAVVSMHTIHHLPMNEHKRAYLELYRVLAPGRSAAIVNGWTHPPLTAWLDNLIIISNRFRRLLRGKTLRAQPHNEKGTYVKKTSARWLRRELGADMSLEIRSWRSASTRILRTFITEKTGGKSFLRWLFRMEDKYPKFFGENGQYPLLVIRK